MPIAGSSFSTRLQANMAAKGFLGSHVVDFCDAIGNGTVSAVTGAPFATVDTGSVPGVGTGAGVGLTGMIAATIATQIQSLAVAAGMAGSAVPDICDCIANALVDEMGVATLTSTHTPVFAGTGVVTVGSVIVAGSALSSSITAAGLAAGLAGSGWPSFADAIGNGQATGFLTATGSVTITGSPTGGPVVPGAGAGVGVIS